MSIEIQVRGQKAYIVRLLPMQPRWDFDHNKEDSFVVAVRFLGAISGLTSVGVTIPAKEYTRDELVKLVEKGAEKEVQLDEARQAKDERAEEARDRLEALAQSVSRKLGIT